jgi:hypothetical protein
MIVEYPRRRTETAPPVSVDLLKSLGGPMGRNHFSALLYDHVDRVFPRILSWMPRLQVCLGTSLDPMVLGRLEYKSPSMATVKLQQLIQASLLPLAYSSTTWFLSPPSSLLAPPLSALSPAL